MAVNQYKKTIVLVISTISLGLIVGLSSMLLGLFLDLVERVFLKYEETAKIPAPLGTFPTDRLLSVVVGAIIVAVIWWFLRTQTKTPISIKKALNGEQMPFWQTILHVMTQIFFVGTGGSVGRELAPREAGALFAQKWANLLQKLHIPALSQSDRQLLMTAAAGAGFAGIYIAPFTGMLFSVEVLLKKLTLRTVAVSLTMSTIAMFVGSLAKGFRPYYLIGDAKFSAISFLLIFILAPIAGVVGALFRKLCQWAESHQTTNKLIFWQLPAMGLITGLIALLLPEIMGNGRSLAQLAMSSSSQKMVSILLFGGLLKTFVTVLTIRAGAAGGTLTPAIAIGAVIGAIVGLFLMPWLPAVSIWQCAVIGAGALLAASQQAPFMAMLMLIEICHLDSSALLSMGVAILIATGVSKKMLVK
ncbi:chloride channel protein [Leuconostoc kimchii]|uniref:Chloride channel protein n=1 Tax=Leuconostoc kimchii TaxID=136609 RepID=A0ABX5SHP4_9LACO|nr:chloride channel protein [Leuconostoc kimchii]QBR46860.1 chloride channel protein [Leuconostoc kimchii]